MEKKQEQGRVNGAIGDKGCRNNRDRNTVRPLVFCSTKLGFLTLSNCEQLLQQLFIFSLSFPSHCFQDSIILCSLSLRRASASRPPFS